MDVRSRTGDFSETVNLEVVYTEQQTVPLEAIQKRTRHADERSKLWRREMAMKPDEEAPFTKEELRDEERRLAMLSPDSVARCYEGHWKDAKVDGKHVPSPRAVQLLVACWKQLWKWSFNERANDFRRAKNRGGRG
jgi:hypothetical protein